MAQVTKREKALAGKVDSNKLYEIDAAIALVKECAKAKFDESIDVAVQLGIDPKKSDLAAQVKAGNLNFDVVIASPDTMRVVGTLGQILGPRGLMPNPKVGTVTPDVATAVKNAKAGQVQYRVDKAGIVHATIGRRSFESDKLRGNLSALLDALNKSKPSTVKGIYLRKLAVSSTMGIGVRVDTSTVTATAA
jgi:large subunit ribosomal protein L1